MRDSDDPLKLKFSLLSSQRKYEEWRPAEINLLAYCEPRQMSYKLKRLSYNWLWLTACSPCHPNVSLCHRGNCWASFPFWFSFMVVFSQQKRVISCWNCNIHVFIYQLVLWPNFSIKSPFSFFLFFQLQMIIPWIQFMRFNTPVGVLQEYTVVANCFKNILTWKNLFFFLQM